MFYFMIIFIFVLFLYIHVTSQYKRSEDLEIYEMDFKDNKNLQEVCDIKQPFLFEYRSIFPEFFDKVNDETIAEIGGSHDLKVKEIEDYWTTKDDGVVYVVLPFSSYQILISTDTNSRYFTEKNNDFVEETKLHGLFSKNDENLKPFMTIQTKYDISIGSKGVVTPMRYHTDYRHFICVNSGKIRVKMTPFKSCKYLHPIKDYDNYEFWSPVNVWKPQEKYMNDMDKLKFIEFDVMAGTVLYVPPYWWYSIKYSGTDTLVSSFTYISMINGVANSVDWVRYFAKQNDGTKSTIPTISTTPKNETSKKIIDVENVENIEKKKEE